jgi:protein TonB
MMDRDDASTPSALSGLLGERSARLELRRARRPTLIVSVALHGVVLSCFLVRSLWTVEELSVPGRRVTLASAVHLSPPPPLAGAATPSVARRRRPPRPVPKPIERAPTEPAPEERASEGAAERGDDNHAVEGGGTDNGSTSGVVGGEGGAPKPAPAQEMSPERRRSLLEKYLQEILRGRIAGRFRYPPEAEWLGLQGLVTVHIAVDSQGRLISVGIRGSCPHQILCDHARKTLRECAPFPPPPPELVGTIGVDVPLSYDLD